MEIKRLKIPTGFRKHFDSLSSDVEKERAIVIGVIRAFLTSEWAEKHVYPGHKKSFFRLTPEGGRTNMLYTVRSTHLATALINCWEHSVPGFDDFIRKFRADPSEGHFAELSIAYQMLCRGVSFAFHNVKQGLSYDFDVRTSFDVAVAVEVKCKVTSARFNAESLLKKLRSAIHEQLPRNAPGALFVQVPNEWHKSDPGLGPVIQKIFSRYPHIVSIYLFTIDIAPAHGRARTYFMESEIVNPHHTFQDKGISRLFRKRVSRKMRSIDDLLNWLKTHRGTDDGEDIRFILGTKN